MKMRVNLEFGHAESSGDGVEIGDRLVPAVIAVHFAGIDGNPELDMTIDSTSGAPRCVDLRISVVPDGREVRTKDVRAVEIDSWIEAIVPLFAMQIVERDGDSVATVYRAGDVEDERNARRVIGAAKRTDRRKVDDALLRRVADTYSSAAAPRDLAVRRAFGVSESTAFRYIRLARERGLLQERD